MKNNITISIIIALAVVFTFTITACKDGFFDQNGLQNQNIGHNDGTLIITDLDGYDGFYVVAFGFNYNYEHLYAAKAISTKFIFTGEKISENRVELNVWHEISENILDDYKGTGKFTFLLYVINKPSFTKAEEIIIGEYLNKRIPKPSWLGIVGIISGTSDTEGKCEAAFKEQPQFTL